jgi:hypothetical protein
MKVDHLLKTETSELLAFLRNLDPQGPYAYEVIETRLGYFKTITQAVDKELKDDIQELRNLQQWFRQESDVVFLQSSLMKRARTWPEGYPGDYLTLEAVYANTPMPEPGVGALLDRYFLSRTLAVAVRSRLRKLADLLNQRAESEEEPATWLNLACGPCRELLSVAGRESRTVWCIDRDQKALNYAQNLLREAGRAGDKVEFIKEDVFQLANARNNIARFGKPTTIYSAGLFDYVKTEHLIKLIGQFYDSLAMGGVLIAPFKDRRRYDTFDYHWLVKWDFFLQRSEEELCELMTAAGIPVEKLTVERDDSGAVLFCIAGK